MPEATEMPFKDPPVSKGVGLPEPRGLGNPPPGPGPEPELGLLESSDKMSYAAGEAWLSRMDDLLLADGPAGKKGM